MNLILRFDEAGSDKKELVGGKGANLGLCTLGKLPVPPGFTITTEAYSVFIRETGLDQFIVRTLNGADYADAADIEHRSARIRAEITNTSMPEALATGIVEGYAALGQERNVAVRSSGTAEDLAEASFAGMHDTFLNVCGHDALMEAVRGCWASLWTDRAVIYRNQKGFTDVSAVRMAVVVQIMVDSEVSGVMFTANPITTATDELVINASWGLGEAIVQGLVTPDEFTVKVVRPLAVGFDRLYSGGAGRPSVLSIKASVLGTKEQRMVRDPASGHGTVTEDVSVADRERFSLSEAQVIELAALGRQVQSYYEEMPQDIEWGFADGRFYLLQARPVTGVDFDWAADMESFQWAPDDDSLWTGQFALLLTGAKSPMYYHWVSDADSAGYYAIGNALNIPDLMGPSYYTNGGADLQRPAKYQIHKYHRGEVYLNGEFEKLMVEKTYLPMLRTAEISPFLPPQYAKEIHAKPFDDDELMRNYAHLKQVAPDAGLFEVLDRVAQFSYVDMAEDAFDASKLPNLKSLSVTELKERLNYVWLAPARYTGYCMIVYFVYWQQMATLMERMIQWWYDGDNPNAYAELCQGVNARSKTQQENIGLHEFAETIRGSETLKALFARHKGAEFFKAIERCDEGPAFLVKYREFVREHGHRGHEDRDFGYPRRFEDPAVDYRSLAILLSSDNYESPYEVEEKLASRRAAVLDDVLNNVGRDPFMGTVKTEAIKTVHAWILRFIELRDDERWAYEKSSLCAKLYCREIGRRCAERGLLADQEDFLMFTKDEMFDLLDGKMGVKLARAKAIARRRDYDRALERTHEFPMFLRDGREVSTAKAEGEGGLVGTGWTSGTVTGTARVVSRLSEVHRVKQGDILVCQSTDPGWTPVFMLLSAIVIETGGVLSHAVCLSREYGLPAVQLRGARKLIPDGATITVNGATGEIVIDDEGEGVPIPEPELEVA